MSFTHVQPRVRQVELCHQLGWSSQAFFLSIWALGAMPKQQQQTALAMSYRRYNSKRSFTRDCCMLLLNFQNKFTCLVRAVKHWNFRWLVQMQIWFDMEWISCGHHWVRFPPFSLFSYLVYFYNATVRISTYINFHLCRFTQPKDMPKEPR